MPISFVHPTVRDLNWLLFCPPLCDGEHFAQTDFLESFRQPLLPMLEMLDARRDPRLLFVNRRTRLGHYYEQLWQLAIELHPDFELIAKDHCIRKGKITIGSVDFIVRNLKTGQLEHWELALKFYLGIEQTDRLHNWIGPGKKDWLADKIERLTTHQITLLNTPEGLVSCKLNGWHIKQRRIILQGRLYAPSGAFSKPDGLNPDAIRGRWYRPSELPDKPWLRLGRYDWLAGRPRSLMSQFVLEPVWNYPKHLICRESGARAFLVPSDW